MPSRLYRLYFIDRAERWRSYRWIIVVTFFYGALNDVVLKRPLERVSLEAAIILLMTSVIWSIRYCYSAEWDRRPGTVVGWRSAALSTPVKVDDRGATTIPKGGNRAQLLHGVLLHGVQQNEPRMADSKRLHALMHRSRRGDANAFEELYALLFPELTSYLRFAGHTHQDAQDIAQETMIALYTHCNRWDEAISPLTTWVYAIAKRKSRRPWRLLRRVLPFREVSEREIRAVDSQVDPSSSRSNSLETEEMVLRLLRKLPARYREPIILFYLQGLSGEEAADVMGVPPATFRTRLHRAISRLQRDVRSAEALDLILGKFSHGIKDLSEGG